MTDYVGNWDCQYCGHAGIDGYVYDCPGCGRPRSRNVHFYLPNNPEVATPEQMAMMGNDPNWYCEHCDSGNKDDNTTCWNCGAERGSSPSHQRRVYVGDDVPHSADQVEETTSYDPDDEEVKPYTKANFDAEQSVYDKTPYYLRPQLEPLHQSYKDMQLATKVTKRVVIGASIVLILLLSYLVYQFFFSTHQVSAYVSGFSWSRDVAIQQYKTLHEESWSVPAGGRTTATQRRQSGTRRVSDGYTTEFYTDTCYRYESVPSTCYRTVYNSRTCTSDNGNGSFSTYDCGSSSTESYSCTKSESVPYSCTKTRQKELYHYEPVYSTWYFYDIDRWVTIKDYPTKATNHNPYYDPVIAPAGDEYRRIEQTGTYTTYFTCEEVGDFDKNYSLGEWSKQNIGDEYVVTTNYWKVVLNVQPTQETKEH